MDFVTLCQRVRQECGIAGEGPTTTIGQTGILKKIVDRTARAWVDIQAGKPYWKFLRSSLSFPLVSAQRTYTVSAALPTGFALTTVDKWDKQSAFIYTTSTADESTMRWIPYQDFRRQHRTYPDGRPTQLTEGPDGTVSFDRTPDAAYTITLDYWKTPELLQNPTEVPACPEQFHDVIVWKSVMMFAGNEMAVDLFNYAKAMFTPMYLQLCIDQLDVPISARNYPLALGNRRTPQTFEDAR